jgi:hypothetical protein
MQDLGPLATCEKECPETGVIVYDAPRAHADH